MTMTFPTNAPLVLLLTLFAGCMESSSTAVGSCASSGAPQPFCEDYEAATSTELSSQMRLCGDSLTTHWSAEPCPTEGVLGGCSVMVGGASGSFTQVTWYYAGSRVMTTGDVMTECSSQGKTFVAP